MAKGSTKLHQNHANVLIIIRTVLKFSLES